MVNIEVPLRTPLSVVFFILSIAIAHFAQDKEFMKFFAYSSFFWFLALGPLRWIEQELFNLPLKPSFGEWGSLGDLDSIAWIHWVFYIAQFVLMAVALWFGISGLLGAF